MMPAVLAVSEADEVASEAVLQLAAQGVTPTEVLSSMGFSLPLGRAPEWRDVHGVIEAIWRTRHPDSGAQLLLFPHALRRTA